MKKQTQDFSALNLLSIPLVIFDNTRVYFVNEKAKEFLKLPKKNFDITKLKPFSFILPEYHKRIKENNLKIIKGQEFQTVELKIRDNKKNIIDVVAKSNIVTVGSKKAVQSIFYEISERKKKYADLEEAEKILDLIGKNNADIMFKYDLYPKEHYSYVSESAENILGYTVKEWYKQRDLFEKILHQEDRNKFPKETKAYIKYIQKNPRNTSRFVAKNGSVVWLETIQSVVKDTKGKVISLLCISRDVTKQKETETRLNITQEQLRLIANNAHDIIYFYTYHPKPKYLFISNSVKNVLGFETKEIYKDPFFFNKRTVGKANAFKEHEKVAAKMQLSGTSVLHKTEFQIINSNGETVWMEDHVNPIRDENGKISFFFGIIRNINALKEKEAELNQKWSDYKLLLDQSPVAFFIHDKGLCLMCNKQAVDLLKVRSEKDILGKFIINYIVPDQRARAMERMKAATQGKEFEFLNYQVTNSKGKAINVEIKTVPIRYNGIDCVLSLVKDISERETLEKARLKTELTEEHNKKLLKEIELRKGVEKKIIEQTSRMKAIFEGGNQTLWTVDKESRYTSFNRKFSDVFYDFYKVYPKVGGRLSDIKDHKGVIAISNQWNEKYKEVFKGGSSDFITTRHDAGGREYIMQFYLHPIYNSDGEIIEAYGLGKDITEKVNAEQSTFRQTAKLSAIFEGSSHYIWTVNKENNLTSFNKNYTDLIQKIYESTPKLGESLDRGKMLENEEYIKRMESNYSKAFEGKKINFELELVGVKGEKIFLDVFLNPVMEKNKIVEVSGIAHDITATKLNEDHIRQSLKEKEVLLKEVHHRVKNNMQIISSILNLQSSYTSDSNILNLLRESQNRIKTMAYIHESLYQNKTFSSINFNEYLTQLISNIVHSYSVSPDKIRLQVNCEKTILNLDVSIPLGLIINELITNSIKHAFPDSNKGIISINLRTQNKLVFLTVEDSGVGIGAHISTEKSGTLGLQLVYTLVDQIDGKISFERTEPQGTRVNISFLI
ncbi:MAG: PAS domain S-box protein [Sphingobacteriaceae bacterium]|nr:PAS domain S-box protein [Sphingobacteriaceae bacterium]